MLFEPNAVTSLRQNSLCYRINSSLHAVLNSCMRQSGVALGDGCGSESAYLQRCSFFLFFFCFFSCATLSSYNPTTATATATAVFPFPHASTHMHTLLRSASSAQVVVSTASAADAQLIMGCDRLADFISEQSPARDGN